MDPQKCLWCGKPLQPNQKRWDSKKCRQTAWRFRQEGVARAQDDATKPLRLAYADPPYPGCAKKYYGKEATYAGEVDHAALLSRLATYDGWALSTSREALRWLLPMCPPEAIPCPWIKSKGTQKSRGPANTHEYVIVVPGRWRLPGPRDSFYGGSPRQEGHYLMGRKSIRFCNWIFQLMGASPWDLLDDLYPGTGIVGKCWKEWCRASTGDMSRAAARDIAGIPETSPGSHGDVFPAGTTEILQ